MDEKRSRSFTMSAAILASSVALLAGIGGLVDSTAVDVAVVVALIILAALGGYTIRQARDCRS